MSCGKWRRGRASPGVPGEEASASRRELGATWEPKGNSGGKVSELEKPPRRPASPRSCPRHKDPRFPAGAPSARPGSRPSRPHHGWVVGRLPSPGGGAPWEKEPECPCVVLSGTVCSDACPENGPSRCSCSPSSVASVPAAGAEMRCAPRACTRSHRDLWFNFLIASEITTSRGGNRHGSKCSLI